MRRLNNSAQSVNHELSTIAYSEDGNAKLQNFPVHSGGVVKINAVRAACEYNALWIHRLDFFDGGLVGFYLAVNVVFADAARDKLIVLTAEIQN